MQEHLLARCPITLRQTYFGVSLALRRGKHTLRSTSRITDMGGTLGVLCISTIREACLLVAMLCGNSKETCNIARCYLCLYPWSGKVSIK
jgi:hypothetical protein